MDLKPVFPLTPLISPGATLHRAILTIIRILIVGHEGHTLLPDSFEISARSGHKPRGRRQQQGLGQQHHSTHNAIQGAEASARRLLKLTTCGHRGRPGTRQTPITRFPSSQPQFSHMQGRSDCPPTREGGRGGDRTLGSWAGKGQSVKGEVHAFRHRQLPAAKMDGHQTACTGKQWVRPPLISSVTALRMGSQDYQPIFESQVSNLPVQGLSTILPAPWLVISLALPLLWKP